MPRGYETSGVAVDCCNHTLMMTVLSKKKDQTTVDSNAAIDRSPVPFSRRIKTILSIR